MKKNIVVIGAGLAGTLISNELAGKCNVTLLEVGERDCIGYPQLSFSAKPLAAVKTVCTGGGGTTNLWHNGLIPIHAKDIITGDFRSVITDAGRFMDRSASLLYWPDNFYRTEYERTVSEVNSTVEKIGVFPDGIDCLLYPKKYRRLEAGTRVQARYSVADIEFVSAGSAIRFVDYIIGGGRHRAAADAVVISAGAFGSPRLVRKALSAVGSSSKNVGIGFMDHPIGFVGKARFKKDINKIVKKLSLLGRGNYECRTAVRLKSPCGNYTCAAFFRPALTMENRLSIYKYKSLLGASSGVDRVRNMFSWRILHPDILAEVVSHLFSISIPGSVYNIFLVFEQKRGMGSVRDNGQEVIVEWHITREELSIYNEILEKLSLMLSGIAEEINLKTDIGEDWLWSHAHHSGTISMGSSPNCCVDQNLKLHHCDNVFVCDGSIIQEHSYANTGLAIGQLALRLAERVSK